MSGDPGFCVHGAGVAGLAAALLLRRSLDPSLPVFVTAPDAQGQGYGVVRLIAGGALFSLVEDRLPEFCAATGATPLLADSIYGPLLPAEGAVFSFSEHAPGVNGADNISLLVHARTGQDGNLLAKLAQEGDFQACMAKAGRCAWPSTENWSPRSLLRLGFAVAEQEFAGWLAGECARQGIPQVAAPPANTLLHVETRHLSMVHPCDAPEGVAAAPGIARHCFEAEQVRSGYMLNAGEQWFSQPCAGSADPGPAWNEDTVAIGPAAGKVGMATGLDCMLLDRQLDLLLTLLPRTADDAAPLRGEYNRIAAAEYAHLLDCARLLAIRAYRPDQPVSDNLRRRMAQFQERASVPLFDHDPTAPAQWCRILLALGVQPATAGTTALALPAQKADRFLHQMRAAFAQTVAAAPSCENFMAALRSTATAGEEVDA